MEYKNRQRKKKSKEKQPIKVAFYLCDFPHTICDFAAANSTQTLRDITHTIYNITHTICDLLAEPSSPDSARFERLRPTGFFYVIV